MICQLYANPVILKEAEKYDVIFTSLIIEKKGTKKFVITDIIKGKVGINIFEIVKAKATSNWFKPGDNLLFLYQKMGKDS